MSYLFTFKIMFRGILKVFVYSNKSKTLKKSVQHKVHRLIYKFA